MTDRKPCSSWPPCRDLFPRCCCGPNKAHRIGLQFQLGLAKVMEVIRQAVARVLTQEWGPWILAPDQGFVAVRIKVLVLGSGSGRSSGARFVCGLRTAWEGLGSSLMKKTSHNLVKASVLYQHMSTIPVLKGMHASERRFLPLHIVILHFQHLGCCLRLQFWRRRAQLCKPSVSSCGPRKSNPSLRTSSAKQVTSTSPCLSAMDSGAGRSM